MADSVLSDQLRTNDFARPVRGQRRAALDQLFRSEVLVGSTLGATLYGPKGRVTYSTDHALIGRASRPPAPSMETSVQEWGGTKALNVYVPVRVGQGDEAGTFALHQDYGPIAASARKAFIPVAGVLELALIGLYLSLFPLLRRVTRRLRGHLEEIEHQALHDGLTGLPNRDLFRRRIEEALAEAQQRRSGVSVLLLDLDRFKEINDTLGHQSGDLLLQALAKRLETLIRDTDTVARLGGDEFAIVSPGAGDEAGAFVLAERIRAGLEAPFALAGLTVEVEASVGIALYPDHGDDVEALIRHADVAMYNGKKTHRPMLYSQKDDHYSPDRLALVGELRRAIANGELVIHYQPRVELATGDVHAVEALVRWDHPERGLLSPGEFLPLAEHTGMIRPLTRYVLDAALADCAGWSQEGLRPGVSVNLSARDLLDADLPREVESLLSKHGVDPTLLEVEITEHTILTDPERARIVLERLRELGVTALDRRLRHRLLVPRPAEAAPGRRPEDRQVVRPEHGARRQRRRDRALDDRARPQPRPPRRRRGRRDTGDLEPPRPARVRHGAGLLHQPAPATSRARRVAEEARLRGAAPPHAPGRAGSSQYWRRISSRCGTTGGHLRVRGSSRSRARRVAATRIWRRAVQARPRSRCSTTSTADVTTWPGRTCTPSTSGSRRAVSSSAARLRWRPTGDLESIEVLDVFDDNAAIPGIEDGEVKAVRVRVNSLEGDSDTFVNHQVKVGEKWHWVLNAAAFRAYKQGRCPR